MRALIFVLSYLSAFGLLFLAVEFVRLVVWLVQSYPTAVGITVPVVALLSTFALLHRQMRKREHSMVSGIRALGDRFKAIEDRLDALQDRTQKSASLE